MFHLFKKGSGAAVVAWMRCWSPAGVILSRSAGQGGLHVQDPMIGAFLTQLCDDGLAVETADGYLVEWDALYAAMSQPAYAAVAEVLSIPRATDARPSLRSNNSLTDEDFSIAIAGWHSESGGTDPAQETRCRAPGILIALNEVWRVRSLA